MALLTSSPRSVDAASAASALLRGAAPSPPAGSSASPASSPDLTAEQQAQIAAQRQVFDFEAAERAEILREHEILEALLMAHLKNEDEITENGSP